MVLAFLEDLGVKRGTLYEWSAVSRHFVILLKQTFFLSQIKTFN